MITPAAIQRKEFARGVRGYREEEVDRFLDEMAADLEAILRENEGLKENARSLAMEIERYRSSENSILSTLESAKALMADISASAEKRAELLLKSAELDAERIRREARDSVERMRDESTALSQRWELFGARFRNLLESELERFDRSAASILFDESYEKGKQPEGGNNTIRPFKAHKIP
ncbi:MAG: DivIVA domain-containing protein [Clostridiales Family XIII bacterium]|jgi:cell division initiation protein|nr:DivIVA domain-containing protein [Clostridiales Family XIII bacterium]